MTEWAKVRTAHGFASHIPEALKRLASADCEVRRRAYWDIDNFAVLQGSLFEAAYYVIGPLHDLLKTNHQVGTRIYCYRLLYEIQNGFAEEVEVLILNGRFVPLMFACKDAVEAGLDIYEKDVLSSDPALRFEAIDLVATLDGRTDDVRHMLGGALASTSDPEKRRDLEKGLRELDEE